MIGIIIKIISDLYIVKYHHEYIKCKARGKFRNDKITPLVGDYVTIDLEKKVITNVLERRNELLRPPVANIDQALIVTSVKEPTFSSNLLDKMLNIITYHKIEPIICFSKVDLLSSSEKKEIKKYINYYRKIGYKVLTNKNYFRLKLLLRKKISVLVGQSGVGKSTLLNLLFRNFHLETNTISKALGRGRHTTRCVELLGISNGLVADTPGFSSLDFIDMTKENIRDNMIEFNKYKDKCKYRNCYHLNEEDCYIKKMVSKNVILMSRYENYKKFISNK